MSVETYYKAVRPDGTDFYSGRVLWDQVGKIVRHPDPGNLGSYDAEGYLSVSVSPADARFDGKLGVGSHTGTPSTCSTSNSLHGHFMPVQSVGETDTDR